MQLDVQWFICALVDNELISLADAVNLNESLGGNPELEVYAQTACDKICAALPPESQNALLEQMQQVVDFAIEQAATGEAPELFVAPRHSASSAEAEAASEPGAAASAAEEAVPEEKSSKAPAPFVKDAPPPPSVPVDDAEPPRTIRGPQVSKLPPKEKIPEPESESESVAAEQNSDSLSVEESTMEFPLTELGIPSFQNLDSLSNAQLAEFMKRLLVRLREYGASDLHLSANSMPFIRRNLKIERIENCILSDELSKRLNFALLSEKRVEKFQKEWDMNFALEIGKSRFRAALMFQKDGVSGSYRIVPGKIHPLLELGFLPRDVETIERLMDYHNGLVLVTGPIGSGKTTTLAALVDIANSKRQDHIITVEDPIEILQESKSCQVTQREIGKHTTSYSSALKGALREDPDIIVIGEMHDLETIENAITASETGHLVIGTLHTCDAANTMNRILDVFPPSQQAQIRAMTAGSLRGIICQRLIPAEDGRLTVAYEILVNTMAIGNIINEGKIYQLKTTMQIGSRVGMCTVDQTLLEKFKRGIISYETAMDNMRDSSEITLLKKEKAIQEAKKLAANMPPPASGKK